MEYKELSEKEIRQLYKELHTKDFWRANAQLYKLIIKHLPDCASVDLEISQEFNDGDDQYDSVQEISFVDSKGHRLEVPEEIDEDIVDLRYEINCYHAAIDGGRVEMYFKVPSLYVPVQ